MAPMAREYFTVDLRGLRPALAARAAERRMTESDVLRSALAAALDADPSTDGTQDIALGDDKPPTSQVKLSVRLPRLASQRLDRQARAAGLSRGAYLTRLIDGAPPVTASADRAAAAAALSQSSAELAVLSRDINHLTQLLRLGAMDAALQYRERLDHLDGDVRSHLDKAATVLSECSSARIGGRRSAPVATQWRPP